jgi:hypothetical protein
MRQSLLTYSRIALCFLFFILNAGTCTSAVHLFAPRKHFTPNVPKEHILAHLDDHLPVLAGESFTISDINEINEQSLAHDLDAVVGTEFFSIFKADLNSQCVHGAVYAQCALEGGCDTTDGPCQNANQRSQVFHDIAGTIPNDWHDFDLSPFKPAPPKISEAIGLLEAYFDAKRISDALPALQQLKSLVDVGDGHEVDRTHVMQEHMKWLEDPAHDLWLVPDGSSAQYFDLRKNDERFTGYGVLALQKEAQAGMPRSPPHFHAHSSHLYPQFGKGSMSPPATCRR